jgi:putative tricarboxylic transport membrane protein
MDLLDGIMSALSFSNLFYCFLGCVLGTLVGVLPGLSPSSTIAILLPAIAYLNPTGTLIMLAGLYYGAMYGGSTTSIMVNIPGEPASVVTCIDGFQMTRQGRGGQALWISAVGSFIAGTFGVIGISFIGSGLAKYAVRFGPPEYCGLLLFSLTMIVTVSGASLLKGIAAGAVGIFLASVGMDPLTGTPRLHFGTIALMKGLDVIPVMVGLFGIGEILSSAEEGVGKIYEGKLGKMMPRGADLRIGLMASMRGTVLGFFLGLLPGLGPAVSAFFAYDFEKRISRHPEKFGTGIIEGVAAPEAANNATAEAGFIPMLALGIPIGPAMAVIMAAMIIQGVQPGPLIFVQQKSYVWAVIGSMYIGNIMLLILNLPLVGLWARISLVPYKILGPIVIAICVIAAYSSRNTMFDVWVAIAFGILGYVMRKKGWPIAPLILGFILGDLFEKSLRQTLSMSNGSLKIFLGRPVAGFFIILTVISLILMMKLLRHVPRKALAEDENL